MPNSDYAPTAMAGALPVAGACLAARPLLELIDPLTDIRWRAFVGCAPDGGVFHHPAWLELLHSQYGYAFSAVCVLDGRGRIEAGVPFAHVRSRLTGSRSVCVPFADVCGPIALPGRRDAVAALLDAVADRHRQDQITVEIRAPLDGVGRPAAEFYVHTLDLEPDAAAVFKRFRSNVRNLSRKAHREGVEVRRDRSAEALNDFYRLHLMTRRRLGVPTQPKRFMQRFEGLFEQGLGFVLRAQLDGRTVAAAVFLTFNGTVLYKFSASDPAYAKRNPNYALLAEAIRWGCENGYRRFDMGRTDLATEGLRSFKRGWGTEEAKLSYTRLSAKPSESVHGAGVPPIVRTVLTHTPALTSRAAGAVLYKHFG